jgi:dihydrofolate reductase
VRISIIAALAQNRVIGRGNALPWKLPADLRQFRALTLGKPVIMGRRTFESLGHPLPGRTNIVVTRNPDYRAPGCLVAHDLARALAAAGTAPEAMIIGGANLYAEALPLADRMYLTLVHAWVIGDTRFPEYAEAEWRLVESGRRSADEKNPYAYTFLRLDRVESSKD